MTRSGRVGQGPAALSRSSAVDGGAHRQDDVDVWAGLDRQLAGADRSSVDLWAIVNQHADRASWRPQLRSDAEIVRLDWARTGPRALISRGADVFTLEAGEAELASLMDSRHALSDLVAQQFEDSGNLELLNVVELTELLRSAGFLTEDSRSVDAALERALDKRSRWKIALKQAVRTLSIEWRGADRAVGWGYRHILRPVMNPVGAVASVALVVSGLVVLGLALSTRHYHLVTLSAGWGFALFLSLNTLIVLIHEIGHAMVVAHNGRKIAGAGARLYYGSPAFYVNSPQALMLPRRQRIFQAFAGPWFEAVAGGIASWVLFLIPSGGLSLVLYRFVVINYAVLALNLVPFLELDGYLIMADVIGVPDLRARALSFYRRDLWRKLGHRERFSRADIGLGVYAVAGLAFAAFTIYLAIFFWRGTFGGVVSHMWHAGPVGVVLLLVLAAVLAGPLLQVLTESLVGLAGRAGQHWHRMRFRLQRRWRVESAEAFDRLDAFGDLPVGLLNDLAGRVRLVTFAPLQTVVRQGEPADTYYLVRRGRLSVVEDPPEGGRRRVLRELGPGDAFGELALVRRAPRSAAVVALERAELFAVDLGTFDRLLAPRLVVPDFGPTVQQAAELAAIPSLRALDLTEVMDLVSAGEWLTVGPGRDLVVQGEAPDGFFLLLEGRVEVLVDGQQVRVLERGSHFGELALLGAGRRTATVRSLTPVRVFRVSVEGFHAVLAKSFAAAPAEGAPHAEDRRS